MKKVELFTDGACSGNPGPGGFGVILKYNDIIKEISAGYKSTTNNRMELLAVITGLETLKFPCEVTVYSDSKYVVDAITNDREPYVSGEDGKRALELVLAIYQSAATGAPVKLPLAKCSTLDFVGRFDK